MKYDLINIDGDVFAEYNGALWLNGSQEPECWRYFKDWSYFDNIRRQVIGTFTFHRLSTEGSKGYHEGIDIRYTAGGVSLSVATLVFKEQDQKDLNDHCPRCVVPGKFVRLALVCPKCQGFLGGC